MPDWHTMSALLVEIPALDGSLCKGKADLYARTVDERRVDGRLTRAEIEDARREALRLCNKCCALAGCKAWFDGLRISQRPRGVVAGQVIAAGGLPAKNQPLAAHREVAR